MPRRSRSAMRRSSWPAGQRAGRRRPPSVSWRPARRSSPTSGRRWGRTGSRRRSRSASASAAGFSSTCPRSGRRSPGPPGPSSWRPARLRSSCARHHAGSAPPVRRRCSSDSARKVTALGDRAAFEVAELREAYGQVDDPTRSAPTRLVVLLENSPRDEVVAVPADPASAAARLARSAAYERRAYFGMLQRAALPPARAPGHGRGAGDRTSTRPCSARRSRASSSSRSGRRSRRTRAAWPTRSCASPLHDGRLRLRPRAGPARCRPAGGGGAAPQRVRPVRDRRRRAAGPRDRLRFADDRDRRCRRDTVAATRRPQDRQLAGHARQPGRRAPSRLDLDRAAGRPVSPARSSRATSWSRSSRSPPPGAATCSCRAPGSSATTGSSW